MNWKLKSAIRHTILSLPGGAGLYRYLTTRVIGTQHGMAAKWFRVFPAHVRVLQQKFGDDARKVPLWCFDSGATPGAGFASALVSDVPGLLTDRWDRLANLYLNSSRQILAKNGADLARVAKAQDSRFQQILDKVSEPKTSLEALSAIDIAYAGNHEIVRSSPWLGKIGLVYSAGTFEHYTPDQVDEELARMHEALRPGGVLSHVMDHRDHRWHADKSISPLLHLSLSAEEYAQQFNNPLEYHNRWLKTQWAQVLEKHGFTVEAAHTVIASTPDLVPLDKRVQDAISEDDRNSLVTHFVAVKR